MGKFKEGDIVVCVKLFVDENNDEEDKDHLILGKEYVIYNTAYEHNDNFPISVIGEQGVDIYFREKNFEFKSVLRKKIIENILG